MTLAYSFKRQAKESQNFLLQRKGTSLTLRHKEVSYRCFGIGRKLGLFLLSSRIKSSLGMWTPQILLILASGFLLVAGKVENPCVLTSTLISKFGVSRTNAANWACLAKFASGYNTQAVGTTHKDGSEDFGIFLINDKYCRKGAKNSCGVGCADLVSDDITPSATCALKIFQKEGFANWPAWKNNCKDINVNRFIDQCDRKPK